MVEIANVDGGVVYTIECHSLTWYMIVDYHPSHSCANL